MILFIQAVILWIIGYISGYLVNRPPIREIKKKTEELEDRIRHHNTKATFAVMKNELVRDFAEEVKLEFYREFDEIIPSIMADKIDELVKKYTEGNDG